LALGEEADLEASKGKAITKFDRNQDS